MTTYGMGSLRKKGTKWYLRIFYQGKQVERALVDPVTGAHPATKAHAERLAAMMYAEIKRNKHSDEKPVRLEELDAMYREAFPHALTAENWRCRETIMRRFCSIFETVDDITHERVGKYISKRLEEPGNHGKLKTSTVNRELSYLKRLLHWAAATEKIARDPLAGYRLLEEPNHRERILDGNEIRRLLAALETPRWRPIRLIVMLGLFCGMRLGEILNLEWEAIDETNQVIDLLKTKRRTVSERRRARRKIPVPDGLWAELLATPRAGDWVFPSEKTGRAMDNIRKSWASLLRECRITGFTFHDLRHTAGTLLAQHTDLATLMEILGHTNPRTAKKYINPSLERKREAVNRVMELAKNHIKNKS